MSEEMVENIDENFNVLRVVTREEAMNNDLMVKTVFVIIKNNKGQFYAAQRAQNKRIYPGLWGIGAGGAVDPRESFEDAARRELKEELGIEINNLKYLFDFRFRSKFNAYKGKVYVAVYDGEVQQSSEEVAQGKWVSKEEVMEIIEQNLLCPDTAEYMCIYFEKFD